MLLLQRFDHGEDELRLSVNEKNMTRQNLRIKIQITHPHAQEILMSGWLFKFCIYTLPLQIMNHCMNYVTTFLLRYILGYLRRC